MNDIQFETDNEEEIDFVKLNAAQNRKHKQAGGWQAMGLDHPVYKGIQKIGYRQPTQIQRKAIPSILDGKDVVAMSRTGSGKTAAFVIPMLQKLKKRDTRGFRALLLSPTRELALQTFRVVKDLGRFTGLHCACLIGGDSMDDQFSALHEHPDILLATPGRLLHIVVEMNLKLNTIQYLVFDEADRLFEMGFAEQLQEILRRVPDTRQTLLFSATLPKMLVDFAKAGLLDPVLVRLDVDSKISEKLEQIYVLCRMSDKLPALLFLCRYAVQNQKQTIVFCATMKHVEYVVAILTEAKMDCAFLYSQLDASARKQNILRFRENQCQLLIVTDVAARGVDIPLLDIAINFHFPSKPKLFIHRVGRVARAGKTGTSFSLIAPDELAYIADLFLYLGRPLLFADSNNKLNDNQNEKQIIIGRFPENLAHLDYEFILNAKETSMEISDLLHKSENAMKRYQKTRALPSVESVRRIKTDFRNVIPAIHPFFEQFEEKNQQPLAKTMLEDLAKYRPNATIFEIQSSGKTSSASIMKKKRKDHQDYINNKRSKLEKIALEKIQKNNTFLENFENNEYPIKENLEEELDKQLPTNVEVVRSMDQVVTVSNFFDDTKEVNENKKMTKKLVSKEAEIPIKKWISAQERKELEKVKHYIAYVPKDAHTEAALAVETKSTNFDDQARQITVDITADDDKGMYREQKRKIWDRKMKKYVQPDDGSKVKKIRTEEGILVPATYKSGRYQKWQDQKKIGYQMNNEEEQDTGAPVVDMDDNDGSEKNQFRPQFNSGTSFGGRGRGRGSNIGSRGFGGRNRSQLGVGISRGFGDRDRVRGDGVSSRGFGGRDRGRGDGVSSRGFGGRDRSRGDGVSSRGFGGRGDGVSSRGFGGRGRGNSVSSRGFGGRGRGRGNSVSSRGFGGRGRSRGNGVSNRGFGGRGRSRGNGVSNRGFGNKSRNNVKNELKSADQIIRERRKKAKLQDYQEHRRKENTKRRVGKKIK